MLGLSALASGVAIGLSVTIPIGPMAILCIHRTLNAGIRAGISTGAGASTVQVAYTSLVLLGFQHVGPFLSENREVMGLASAAIRCSSPGASSGDPVCGDCALRGSRAVRSPCTPPG